MTRPTLEGRLLFPSNYLCAEDLQGRDAVVEIDSVGTDDLRVEGGATKRSFLIGFRGKQKKLVCNKTNATMIASIHGQEAKSWVGKRITLYPTKTKLKKEMVPCVRVRPASPDAAAPQGDDILNGASPNSEPDEFPG